MQPASERGLATPTLPRPGLAAQLGTAVPGAAITRPQMAGGEGRGDGESQDKCLNVSKPSLCRQPFGERRPQKETCLFEAAADDPNPTFSADYLFLSFPSWTRLAGSQMPRVPAACPGNLSFNELRQLALKMRSVPRSERGKRQQPPFALWMITSHAYYFPP